MSPSSSPAFEHLSPDLIASGVESVFDLRLTGVMTPYSSYINRVYGLEDEEGDRFVAKFYRPGRWSTEAILEEHRFVIDCAEEDVPVVAPLPNRDGTTLQSVVVETDAGEARYNFALYPSRGGRLFDAEGEEEWVRLGSLIGRMHAVGKRSEAPRRLVCTPSGTTERFVAEIEAAGVVHPELNGEFHRLVSGVLDLIGPLFDGVRLQRIHGDCHRGNILDRPGEGLMLIDFDDMLVGPVVQDIWLLLPDYAESSYRELELIIEGYEQFGVFERETLALIEPLRFMRMIHYLAWAARQRDDHRFRESFPDWGSKAFWIKEIEDLRVQERVIRAAIG